MKSDRLAELVARSMSESLPPGLAELADAVRARHEPGVLAILAYGSVLRGTDVHDTLVDLYVLTENLRAVSANPLSRLGCWLVPPNVYYAEAVTPAGVLRCKYAALPLRLFERKMRADTDTPYFWARFSQPARVVYTADDGIRSRVNDALATAVRTMISESRRLAAPDAPSDTIWKRGLAHSYGTELRVETAARADEIVAANASWFTSMAAAIENDARLGAVPAGRSRARWRRRRIMGKCLSVARLVKAAFTFTGGADYIAWKIERHSGVAVELTSFERAHPIVASLWLLPKLYLRKAIR